jgi:hypothetical protein
MINNLEIIKPLLNFEQPGDFYMLYVFKRKKDQPEGERDNHQSVRTIKTYCIESIEHLEKRYEEIKQLCEMFKARAYIHIQKQNHSDVSLNMMVALAEKIRNGQHNQKNLFDSVVGQLKTKKCFIQVDQERAIEELGEIEFDKSLLDSDCCSAPLHSQYRSVLGQVNWLQSRTQYKACYRSSRCASAPAEPTIAYVRAMRKLVRSIRSVPCVIKSWPLRGNLRLVGYPEATYKK